MSDRRQLARNEEAKAKFDLLAKITPQGFSSPNLLSGGANKGQFDAWMMSILPPSVILPLEGLYLIGMADQREDILQFVSVTLSALGGANGAKMNMLTNITVAGLGGGNKGGVLKRNNIWDRLRGRPEYEVVEPQQQEEEQR